MKEWFSLIILALILAFYASAAFDAGKTVREPQSIAPFEMEEPLVVTYEKDIKPIIGKYCSKCHSKGTRNWLVYENAFMHRKAIYNRVVITRDMPTQITMPERNRYLIMRWYKSGAPQ